MITFRMVYTALAAFIGGPFIFGYSIGCLNVPSRHVKTFINQSLYDHYGIVDDSEATWTTALFSVAVLLSLCGGAISSLWSAELSDKIGRRHSVMSMQVFTVTGAICIGTSKIANSFELLFVGRFLVGLATGCCMAISPMYGSELSPQRLRGAFGAASQLMLVFGIFVSSCFTLEATLGSEALWPIGISAIGFFGLLSAGMLLFGTESPKWLLAFRDVNSSQVALRQLCKNEDIAENQLSIIKAEVAFEKAVHPDAQSWTLWKLLKSSQYRWPLALATALNAAQQLSGINTVFFFAVTIYENVGFTGVEIDYAALATSAVNVVVTIVAIFLIDHVGRRTLALLSLLVVSLSLTALVTFLSLTTDENKAVLSWLSLAAVEVFVVGFALGLGPLPIFSAAELFPPGPRASASGFASAINFLSVLAVALLFENVLVRYLMELSFLPFLIMSVGFLIFFWFKLPETKNRPLSDIYLHHFGYRVDASTTEVPQLETRFTIAPPNSYLASAAVQKQADETSSTTAGSSGSHHSYGAVATFSVGKDD